MQYIISEDHFARSAEKKFKNMRLIIGGEQALADLDDAAIRDAVQRLASLSRGDLDTARRHYRDARRAGLSAHMDFGIGLNPFLILEPDPSPGKEHAFIQAAWHPPSRALDTYGFLLGYNEGSGDEYHECFPVSVEEAIEAFIEYFHGGDGWKERFNWKRIYP